VGSYGYIPLEQFSGQATPASDLYSLGMTLIYLLTGVHPADLPQENGRVKFNDKGISRPLVRWVEKMTYPYLNKRFSSATTALNNLYSNQISDGYHLNLKPDNSEVTLNCNGDKLEISIRTISYTTNFAMWLFISPFLSYILLCLSAVNPFSIIFVKLLSIIVFILVFIMFFFLEIVDYLTVISIEKDNEISLSYKFFDFIRWKKISSATQKINLIAYNPGYQFDSFLDSTGREQYQTATVKINPSLSVYAGTKEFKIGGKYPLLSQAEYWWLAQALSEFLELDVQVIYPTPKVPPEQNCDGC
jgi:serine/threonine protein kinase